MRRRIAIPPNIAIPPASESQPVAGIASAAPAGAVIEAVELVVPNESVLVKPDVMVRDVESE